MRSKYLLAALAAAMLMLTTAACGKAEKSGFTKSESKSANNSSTVSGSGKKFALSNDSGTDYTAGGDYDAPESMKKAAAEYDPEGDTRMYDVMKKEFDGDFYIELNTKNVSLSFNVKDGEMSASNTVNGMTNRAFYFADKTFYNISDATSTYTEYSDYEFDLRNSDPLFGGTGEFSSAEINSDGNITEIYSIDSDFAGTEGTIRYTFSKETGALMNYELTANGGDPMFYTVDKLSNSDKSLLELPDLSSYNQNGGETDSSDEKTDSAAESEES